MARKRLTMIFGGLLAAGAAAGAGGAMVSRRRQQRWQEYTDSQPITGIRNDAKSMMDFARTGMDAGLARAAESVKEKAADLTAGSASGPTTASAPVASTTPIEFGTVSDPFSRAGSTGSRNSRSS